MAFVSFPKRRNVFWMSVVKPKSYISIHTETVNAPDALQSLFDLLSELVKHSIPALLQLDAMLSTEALDKLLQIAVENMVRRVLFSGSSSFQTADCCQCIFSRSVQYTESL